MTAAQELIGLPTQTVSGEYLGRVCQIELAADGLEVEYFHIRPVWLKRLWCRRFIVSKDQVVKITSEKIVVDDTLTKISLRERRRLKLSAAATK